MVELEIDTTAVEAEPEKEVALTIDQTILKQLAGLDEDVDKIVIVDYAFVKDLYDKFKDITTIRRMIDVPDIDAGLVKTFEIYEEEIKSTKKAMAFIKIVKTLFSNAEIDYYSTFLEVKNAG